MSFGLTAASLSRCVTMAGGYAEPGSNFLEPPALILQRRALNWSAGCIGAWVKFSASDTSVASSFSRTMQRTGPSFANCFCFTMSLTGFETPPSGDDLELPFACGADDEVLQNAVGGDARGQLLNPVLERADGLSTLTRFDFLGQAAKLSSRERNWTQMDHIRDSFRHRAGEVSPC